MTLTSDWPVWVAMCVAVLAKIQLKQRGFHFPCLARTSKLVLWKI